MDIRNSMAGFSARVRKNLDFMLEERADGADVHIVTELTTALLGLVVYPYQFYKDNKLVDFRKYTMERMSAEGWPEWTFHKGGEETKNLRHFLRRLRNGTSHYLVSYSSESRKLDEVFVTFGDRPDENKEIDWEVEIRADHLLEFTRRLAGLLTKELAT